MLGYVLKQEYMKTGMLFPTWEDLVERLEEMDSPKISYTIEPCIYYEGDFKDKNDEQHDSKE